MQRCGATQAPKLSAEQKSSFPLIAIFLSSQIGRVGKLTRSSGPIITSSIIIRVGLWVWCVGIGRQERSSSIPGEQLPEHDAREAVHLHDADETGRRLEPDPVQPVRLHAAGVRHQLHRDTPRPSRSICRIVIIIIIIIIINIFNVA